MSFDVRPLIGIPMERTVTDIAFLRFWEIARESNIPLIQLPYGRCDVNRNRIARFLMSTDYTHVIMLDLDHIHPIDIAERLLRWQVDDPKKLVVGGLNFMRAKPYEACAYLKVPYDNELHSIVRWDEGIAKVDAIGFGCISFSREVFDIIPDPWFRTIYTSPNDFPGEDMYFSEQCHKYGVDIWCDTSTTSPHIGVDLVDQEFFHTYLTENPVEIVEKEETND